MRVFAVLLLAAFYLFSADTALAHAVLIASEPVDGALLSKPPGQVKLNFSEVVAPLALRLLDSTGKVTLLKAYRQEQQSLIVDMPSEIGVGTSILSWRVTSQDGHPVGGTVSFSINRADQERLSSTIADQERRFPLWLAHVLNVLLLATVIGGAFFYNWIASARIGAAARWLMLLSPLAILVALARFVAETLDAVGDISGLSNVSLWWQPVAATSGISMLVTVVALTLAALSLGRPGRRGEAMSLIGIGLAGLAFAINGHAAAASPQVLMKPLVLMHLAALLFWSGSLVPLFVLLRRGLPDSIDVLKSYDTPIRSAIMVLVPSGIVIASVQLGAFSELWNSGYGVVLLIKLALLAVLFGLAGVNRFSLTPRIQNGDVSALRLLRASIVGEIGLVIFIFCVTSLWRFTPPPREMSAVTVLSTGIQFHAHGTRGMANLLVSPARPGPVAVSINVMDVQSRPLDVKGVDIVLLDPENRVEPIRQQARRVTLATWRIDEMPIPMAGTWLVRINLLITPFDKVTVRTTLNVRNP
ncbi:copper resistance CopC/CopD family protein [Bradyrhizobium erythrophlei]|uniref:Copper transport protein n=1 Tax=Bradyrhizobium erythrophlei TaxID=1437360 RepID=A0A1H4UKQ5_9BRAD|nr:CopD family protein [Bradyrhizobium erythrophlei]SEC68958.1 copper transport protein [Bradyrhizobium erythrophlei]